MKKYFTLFLLTSIILSFTSTSFAQTNNEIIAKINGQEISQKDFNRLLNAQKKKLIDQLINETLLLQEAKAKNLTISEEEITKKLAQLKEKQGGEEAFNKFLTENNATLEDAKNEIRNQLLIQLVKNQTNNLNAFLADKKSNSNIVIYTNKVFSTTTCLQPIPSDPVKMEESISKALVEEIQKDGTVTEPAVENPDMGNKIFISDIKEDTIIEPISGTISPPTKLQKKWFKQKPEDEILVPGTPLTTQNQEAPIENKTAQTNNIQGRTQNSSERLKELRKKIEQRRFVNR